MFLDKFKQLEMFIKKSPTKSTVILIVTLLFVLTPIFLNNTYSQSISSRNFQSEIISLANITPNASQITPSWNILGKLSEKDDELSKISVSMGPREITYYENRISLLPYTSETECQKRKGQWNEKDNSCKSVVRKRFSDKEITLGLKILDTETGEVEVIKANTKVTPVGVNIVTPTGYQIVTVERPNGIRWNLWNTSYKVLSPENRVVIKNYFPKQETVTVSKVVKGKARKTTKKIVTGFLYVPHSDYFEEEPQRQILVEAGKQHLKSVVSKAFEILRERGVKSRTLPNKLIVEVEALQPRFFERIPLLEQGDLTEFKINPQKTAERVLIILGANRENAWKYTCNRSSACGWVQFTPRTYRTIRATYSSAKLMADFKTGAGDQLNSIMSAALLHEYNLDGLVRRFGKEILSDPLLEEYLAASYNGSPNHVFRSLNATLGKSVDEWGRYLKTETEGFMFKLRYLINNDLP